MRMWMTALVLTLVFALGAVAHGAFTLVDIEDWVNNDGISWIEYPGDQDFDGGGWGFPAEELPDGDFEVVWDENTIVPFKGLLKDDGWGNNIEADGQEISLPAGNYAGVWILASNHHGATTDTPITFHYRDGSITEGIINAGDWCGSPVADEKMVLKPAYRHDPSGVTGPSCGLWLLPRFDLDPSKELVSLTLPVADKFHVFGITLQH